MSVLGQVRDDVSRLLQEWKGRVAAINLVPADVEALATEALGDLAVIVQASGAAGDLKREAVLEGLGMWFDEVIEPLDLPYVPDRFADPILRSALLWLGAKIIDGIVAGLKKRGVLKEVAA